MINQSKVEKSVKVSDITPPSIELDGLKVDKSEVKSGDNLKISIKASDDMSGISQLDIRYKALIAGKTVDVRINYNSQTDRYEGKMYIDNLMEDGLWKIEFIFMIDNQGNYKYIDNSNINNYVDKLEEWRNETSVC